MSTTILSVCPKLYSTRISVSEDEKIIYQNELDHSGEDFVLVDNNVEQLPFRRDAIMLQLRKDGINLKNIQYVATEGGLLRPCKSGVYTTNH